MNATPTPPPEPSPLNLSILNCSQDLTYYSSRLNLISTPDLATIAFLGNMSEELLPICVKYDQVYDWFWGCYQALVALTIVVCLLGGVLNLLCEYRIALLLIYSTLISEGEISLRTRLFVCKHVNTNT